MNKKIIFDIGHPGQVHQFKYLYWHLENRGWKCLFVAKDKEFTKYLLNIYNLDHIILSRNKKGTFNKIINLITDEFKFFRIVNKFKPDYILNRFSLHSAHISKLLGVINIGFADTEHTKLLDYLTLPFINIKFTGNSYTKNLGTNHFKYDANIELFYLHPNIYKHQENIRDFLNIKDDKKYCIVRFVSWTAHHDVGVKKMTKKDKIQLIKFLNNYYKVFVSSESELPAELRDYKLNAPPELIHPILKEASLYIGEGGTMASEAACLNTPVIYTNSLPLMGYLREAQKFGLLHHLLTLEDIIHKIKNLEKGNFKEFINKKINPTPFIAWFIENYPESKKIMKENPDYQYRFR